MDVFTKKNPKPKPLTPPIGSLPSNLPIRKDEVRVDYDEGTIYVPGQGHLPLIGPTSGQELRNLQASDEKQKKLNLLLRRQMLSTWRCTQCKRIFQGTLVRIKWRSVDGINMETLVCPDPKCDAPVIIYQDALSLIKPPGGDRGVVDRDHRVIQKLPSAEDVKKRGGR